MFIHICMPSGLGCRFRIGERIISPIVFALIYCLKRFIARRGKPRLVISNNAPQFRLVKTTLDEQWNKTFQSNEVLNYFSYETIQWNFTTAFAPWQGGFYEQLVGRVKQSLRKGTECMGHKILG